MILDGFEHYISSDGFEDEIRVQFLTSGYLGTGISASRLPENFLKSLRAYLLGDVMEPVVYQLVEVDRAMGLRWDVPDSLDLKFQRMAPSVVGPHDGHWWWNMHYPSYRPVREQISGLLALEN